MSKEAVVEEFLQIQWNCTLEFRYKLCEKLDYNIQPCSGILPFYFKRGQTSIGTKLADSFYFMLKENVVWKCFCFEQKIQGCREKDKIDDNTS